MSLTKLVEPTTIGGSVASIFATSAATIVSWILCRVVLPMTVTQWLTYVLFGFGFAFVLWYGWCLGRAVAERANRTEQS